MYKSVHLHYFIALCFSKMLLLSDSRRYYPNAITNERDKNSYANILLISFYCLVSAIGNEEHVNNLHIRSV